MFFWIKSYDVFVLLRSFIYRTIVLRLYTTHSINTCIMSFYIRLVL